MINGTKEKVVVGGEIVNGEIVGGTPIAEVNSWSLDTEPPLDMSTTFKTYECTGTFKMSWWRRLKMKRWMRRMFPANKKIKMTFVIDSPLLVYGSSRRTYENIWAKDVHEGRR